MIRLSYDLKLIGNLSLPPFLYYVDVSQSRPILLYGISKVRFSPAGRLWWPKNTLVGSCLVASYVIYRYSPSCYCLGNRSLLSSGNVLFASVCSSKKPQAMVYFWPLSLKAAARSDIISSTNQSPSTKSISCQSRIVKYGTCMLRNFGLPSGGFLLDNAPTFPHSMLWETHIAGGKLQSQYAELSPFGASHACCKWHTYLLTSGEIWAFKCFFCWAMHHLAGVTKLKLSSHHCFCCQQDVFVLAEPVLLTWQLWRSPVWAKHFKLVMVRWRLDWKLDFRALARSSAEGSSIVVAIGT